MSGHQGIFGVDQHFVIHAGGHEIRSMQDVARFCEDCCRSLGFAYFFFSFRVPLLEPKPSHFAFTNYPKSWLESYKQRGYIHFDPVFERVTHSLRPFPWSAVRRDHPVMKAMFEEMATLGLVDGLCIPLHGPNGAHAVLNMASNSPVTTAQPQLDRLMANSLLFVAKVFDRAIAVVAPLGRDALPAELTERQAAVLRLIAEGKSYRAIGDALGIEPSTVKTLIERSLVRLGVKTREQAIVKAIATGQIHPVSRPAGFSVQQAPLQAATVLIETRASG